MSGLPFPDYLYHNNPDLYLVDSDFIKGGKRKVADLTALYALITKVDQLKENVTVVNVLSSGIDYQLTDIANAGNSGGWTVYWNQGFPVYDARYAAAFSWSDGFPTYDLRYARLTGATFTGPITLSGNPVSPLQAVTKAYVDALNQNTQYKDAARAGTLSNITLSGEQTIDTVACVTGDRVLVKAQTDPKQNGIYIVDMGAWSRSADADLGTELLGATLSVLEGTTANTGILWNCNTPGPITIGSSNIIFIKLSTAVSYINGTGLDLTGNIFSISANGVNFSLFQQISANKLIGNPTAVTADADEIGIGAGLSFVGGNLVNTITNTNQLTNGANFITAASGFVQNGNTFGADGVLGTADNFNLKFIANNTVQLTLNKTTGNLEFTNGLKLPVTTSSAGIIYQGSATFIHSYGFESTFLGQGAGNLTFTGTGENVGIGAFSMASVTSGAFNVGVGSYALNAVTTASALTAVGYLALFSNTTGTFNNAIGSLALQNNTTGSNLTAFGSSALRANTTGSNSAAFGPSALLSNTTGANNFAMGPSALRFNTIGNNNFALGFNTMRNNVSGSNTVAIGYQSGTGVSGNSYSNCLFIGYNTGNATTTGSNNLYLGYNTGSTGTTASNNLLVGYDIQLPATNTANFLSIGNVIFSTGLNGTGTTVSTGNLGIFIAAPSYKFSVLDEFYYDGSSQLGLEKSINTALGLLINNSNTGTTANSRVTLYNNSGAGLDMLVTSTGFAPNGNVFKSDRVIFANSVTGGTHFWNAETTPFDFWIGNFGVEQKIFEITYNTTTINTSLATSIVFPVTSNVLYQMPDNVFCVHANKATSRINLPLNPVNGQYVIVVSASAGGSVIITASQTIVGITSYTIPLTFGASSIWQFLSGSGGIWARVL